MQHLINTKTFDKKGIDDTTEIKIPIYDVYIALLNNGVIDLEQLMTICHELQKSSTFSILSNRSLKPIDINSKNTNDMLNNMFVRKFYSIKRKKTL